MGAMVYKAAGNVYGVKNCTDGRKSENQLLERSNNWVQILSRAKNFVRNIPVANAIKNTFEVYCGCLTPVEGCEESRAAFSDWAKHAGMESGQSLAELAALLVGVMTWGDCLAVLGSDPYAPPGTVSARLKLIDPLQVETPPKYRNKGIEGNRRVVLGVALDKNDIELGYYVRKAGTDGNSDSDYQFFPRYEEKTGRFVSMLVRAPGSLLPGQVRSFPMLASSMDIIDVLEQLNESAGIEAKTKSDMSVMIESKFPAEADPSSWASDSAEEGGAAKQPEINLKDLKPGEVIFLPPGTTPHIINNSGNLELVEQIKQQHKIIAGNIGIPYAAMMSDFEKMSFSSSKMMMAKLFLLVEQWNYGPVMRLFSEIYRCVCLEYYLRKGEIPAPEQLVCNWQSPSQPDPDPVKSANADKIRRAEGVKNRTDIVGSKGDDYRDYLLQKKKEIDMEREILGVTLDELLGKPRTKKNDEDDDDEEDEE